jgi:hypothetical protein
MDTNDQDHNATERQRWGGPSPWAGKDSRTAAQKRADGPPPDQSSGDKLREMIEQLVWVAGIEGDNLRASREELIRIKAAQIFYQGEVSGFTKYRARVREWIKSFPEGY